MAGSDPTDSGGLFIGRRSRSAPARFRTGAQGDRRHELVAGGAFVFETLLCLSLFGPQPVAWLWIGSQVQYITGEVTLGLLTIMAGCLTSLMLTVAFAKRVDHLFKLARRAAGHHQERGVLETIFAVCVGVAVVAFSIWFFLVQGPAPSLAPTG